jgi:hypothetical protein
VTLQNSEIDGQGNALPAAIYPGNFWHYRRYQNYTIRGNHIHDIGSNSPTGSDNHCIGVQGIDGLIIEGNYLENCGAGIVVWPGSRGIENWQITYNYLKDMNGAATGDQFPGCGIVLSGYPELPEGTVYGEGMIAHNILDGSINTNPETWWKGNGIRTSWGSVTKIYHNVISEYPWAVVPSSDDASVDFRNNVVLNSKKHHMAGSVSSPVWLEDYNLYYPDGPEMFRLDGYMYSLAEYSSKRGGGVNAHSLSEDPNLGDDFRPLNGESPVVGAGFDFNLRCIASGAWPRGAGGSDLDVTFDADSAEIGAFCLTSEIAPPGDLRVVQ